MINGEGEQTAYNGPGGHVVIPEGVTQIDRSVFQGNQTITTVVVPEGVIYIGEDAFSYSSLQHIDLPDSLYSIASSAFAFCTQLTEIYLPPFLGDIGDCVFNGTVIYCNANSNTADTLTGYGYSFIPLSGEEPTPTPVPEFVISEYGELTAYNGPGGHVVIPEGVKYINPYVFQNNQAITTVVVPEGVQNIEWQAFAGSSLQSIELPTTLCGIDSYAFEECSQLAEIYLPPCIEYLGECVFPSHTVIYCDLESNTINILEMGGYSFIPLVNGDPIPTPTPTPAPTPTPPPAPGFVIDESGTLTAYNGTAADVVIPESVTAIGSGAFKDNQTLRSVVIHEGVTIIGDSAFYNCDNLKEIDLPEGLVTIESLAFFDCNRLERVFFPDSMQEITGSAAFKKCSALKEVRLPAGLTTIGTSVFVECTSLTTITFPASLQEIGNRAFLRCTSLSRVILPEGLRIIRDYAFLYCDRMVSITVPASVGSIGEESLPGGATVMGYRGSLAEAWATANNRPFAALDSSTAKVLILPSALKEIGEEAFLGTSAEVILLPDGCERITSRAFADASCLHTILIPASVVSLADDILDGCDTRRVCIVAPKDSAAHQWALRHSFLWMEAK